MTGNSCRALWREAGPKICIRPKRRRVDLEAWAHRRGDRYTLDVVALGACRLRLDDGVSEGLDVVFERLGVEGGLADAGVDDTSLLDAELDGAALGNALTAPATSMVTVPTFGFGIMPRGPSTLPRRPTSGIMSGVAMQRSKSILPPWTMSTRSSAPTMSCTGSLGFISPGAASEDGDANVAARAVRQVDHAADHLVGVARVNAEVHGDFDGFVELGDSARLDHARWRRSKA